MSALLRAWRTRRGHSLAVVLALAAGFVVALAAASLISAFLLRPLPLRDIDRLVRLREVRFDAPGHVSDLRSLSPATWRLWRERADVFTDIAAATSDARSLTSLPLPERLQGAAVTTNFFSVLGLQPRLGRTFGPADEHRTDLVLISHGLWQRAFGGAPDAVGRPLELDGRQLTVIGVMGRGIAHPYSADYWVPLDLDQPAYPPGANFLYAPARLKPGVSIDQAEQALARLCHDARAQLGDVTLADGARLTPLRDELLRDLVPVLMLIAGAALLVLVLSLMNASNLMLAAAIRDTRSSALRIALGATRVRLFQDALARNASLVLLAAGAAVVAVEGLLPHLYGVAGLSPIDEFDAQPRLDLATAGWLVVIALVAAALLAWVEVRAQARSPVVHMNARGSSGSPRARRAMGALAAAQLALSFALLGCAAGVLADYRDIVDGNPGYAIAGRVLLNVSFAPARYPDTPSRVRAAAALARELGTVPGVRGVGAATVTPDWPGSWSARFRVPGLEPPAPGYFETNHDLVSADYFSALGIPIVAGRTFTPREMQDPENRSVIVSQSFARRFFGSGDPLGREIRQVDARLSQLSRRTVVGVVGDVQRASFGDSWPVGHGWYLPLSAGTRYDLTDLTLVVHVDRKGPGLFQELRRAILRADPGMAASQVAWMRERLVKVHSRNQLSSVLYSLFGGIALLVAAVGLFSLQSFLVSARRREFGVRLALGASPRALLLGVLGASLRLDLLAIVAGLPLLLVGFRLYRSFASGSAGLDPVLPAAAALVLLASSLLASWFPALRAARLRPARILQDDTD